MQRSYCPLATSAEMKGGAIDPSYLVYHPGSQIEEVRVSYTIKQINLETLKLPITADQEILLH